MQSSAQIQAEIEEKFGFSHPFFALAAQSPEILDSLWQQTQSAYLQNPLPILFKEKLLAYLSHCCSVSYCLISHSCTLSALGIKAKALLEMLKATVTELTDHFLANCDLAITPQPLNQQNWPEPDSETEKLLLASAILLFFGSGEATRAQMYLRQWLTPQTYSHLIAFLSYVKSYHQWVRAYPELAVETDHRVQDRLQALYAEESQLADLFQACPVADRAASELQHLKQQLQASEARFRTCFDHLPSPMMIYGEDGEIYQINQVWAALTGYTRAEISTIAKWTELTFGEHQAIVRSHLEQVLDLNSWQEAGEFTILTRTGEQRIWDFSFAPLPAFSDGKRLAIAMAKDITERQRFELELTRWQEKRFRAVFEQTFQFTGLLRPDGILLEVNSTAQEFAQLQEGIIGQPFWEVRWWQISQETQDKLQEAIASAASGELVRYEIDILGTDDAVATIDFSIKPVTNETGKVILLIPEGRDITKYKQALASLQQAKEQLEARVAERTADLAAINQSLQREINERIQIETALKESESRLKLALNATSTGIWDWDLLTYSDTWTENTEALFGLKPGEFKGTVNHFLEFIHPSDRVRIQVALDRAIESRREYDAEYRIIWPDGSIHWLESKGQVVCNEAGQVVRMVGTDIDITERKQAEIALQNLVAGTAAVTGVEFFPALVRHLAAALNVRYAIVTESPIERPDIVKTIAYWAGDRLQSNCEYDLALTPCEQVIKQGKTCCYSNRLQELFPEDRVLVTMRAVSYLGLPLFDSSGAVIGHLCMLDDQPIANEQRLTSIMSIFAARAAAELERQRTETALRQNEKKYRTVVNHVKDVIFQTDFAGTWTFLNPAWTEITGYAIAESIGTNMLHYLATEVYEQGEAMLEALVEQQQPDYRQELRLLTKAGSDRWIEIYARLTFDANKIAIGISGTLNDITERKRNEEEIRLLQMMMQAISEAPDFDSALAITLRLVCEATGWNYAEAWIPNEDGILTISPAWYGSTPHLARFRQESENMTFLANTGIPGRVLASRQPEWMADVTQGRTQAFLRVELAREIGLKAALGVPIVANEQVVAVFVFCAFASRAEDKRLVDLVTSVANQLGLAIDRKLAEQQIKQLNEALEQRVIERTAQLEAANKELEAFSYSVSHDLRSPLRSIDGFSQVLMERYGTQFDERGQHYLQRIRAGSQRMGELIDDLLELSRVTRSEMQCQRVDLSAIASQILTELQASQPERQVEVAIAPQLEAHGDPRLLRIVLENLLNNAWKYTSHHPTARIEFGAIAQADGKLAYYVRDDGAGFDMAYVKRLFSAFQRLHSDTDFPGTGIGLATVQRIILRHGGEVWAQAEIEQGATFYFSL